jgi:hypothetical protein
MLSTDEPTCRLAELEGNAASGYSLLARAHGVGGTLVMDQIRIVWQSPLIPFAACCPPRLLADARCWRAPAAIAQESPDA